MIGNSLVDYINIRLSITALRLVAPTSIIYLVFSFFRPECFVIPIGVVAAAEASFYLLVYLPRRRRLQAPPTYTPPPLTREERRRIFAKCVAAANTSDSAATPTPYPTGWFLPKNTIPKREDVIDWLLWALFSATTTIRDGSLVEENKEEIDGYIEEVEQLLGRKLESGGDSCLRSMRITLDPVGMLHRPLVWYSIVAIVDTYTSLYLTFLGFKHYSPRKWNWRYSFPPRPILSLLSRPAPEGVVVPYWYRPHRSSTKLPLVFLHGIGIGLFPYVPFIQSIVNVEQDPDIGILLPELLPISMHMTPQAVAPRLQMLASLNTILEDLYSTDKIGWNRVVFAAHSYGTFIAGWIVRDCVTSSESMIGDDDDDALINKIAHLVLIDPIPILISDPSVAHNFLYREPWTTTASSSSYSAASSWQLWYFASRDADVARTLCRSFFWSEGGMWREEVAAFLKPRRKGRMLADGAASLATYRDDEVDDDDVSPTTTLQMQATAAVQQHRRRRNMAVVLGGSDQIIPAEAIRRYLTNEDIWKTRWVGKVDVDSQSEVVNGSAVGGEEEEDRAEGSQLEVLYDPGLDHAKIFDDEEDIIPLLEVVRRYVRDV
ncbi:hypothetical protein BYT27DRAFT_7336185 [Phlegmacium glaucopus]|nr:hypothetical protein BYT27DRAFT_7336185 [Phlegmacium glaucopus]